MLNRDGHFADGPEALGAFKKRKVFRSSGADEQAVFKAGCFLKVAHDRNSGSLGVLGRIISGG